MFDWQELEEVQQEVEEKMSKKLQMPPVMAERDAASKVISWSMVMARIITNSGTIMKSTTITTIINTNRLRNDY